MWCSECGQDVPGVSLPASGRMSCARCGGPLSHYQVDRESHAAGLSELAAHGVDLGNAASHAPLERYEDWELAERVRRAQARTGSWRRLDRGRPMRQAQAAWAAERQMRRPARLPRAKRRRAPRPARRTSLLAWTLLSLGMMAFACGTALLVLSFVAGRQELWSLGMPVAVGGQVGLLLGLMLQLERVFQNSRYAVSKLDTVDTQLHQLERTTSLLGVTHGTAAQAYYTHLADDAPAEVLLADLKGQLDLLAAELGRRQ